MSRPEAVAVLGTGMTDMSRRDLSPEAMAHQAVHEALVDARVEPHQLTLVVAANAMGGRLCDQGCVRGEAWLRKAGLGDVPVVNVDNSCAGGTSALHLGSLAARADGTVLVVGVEKMWTGDRSATLAGIEDGLAADYRADLHARFRAEENPAGSILMGLNDSWARQCMRERGTTVEQMAAAAVKARANAARNPLAQVQQAVTLTEVLSSPQVSGVLTRLMCSSFTDGAAAVVLSRGTSAPKAAPRIIGSVARSGNGSIDYHDRLAETAQAAWEAFGCGPRDFDMVELHDATSAEEIFALESLGLFGHGEAGPATLAGETAIGGTGLTVNPSGGLVGRGHPLGATGIAQVVELATHLRQRGGERQVPGARLGLAVNTGGVIEGDAAYVGMHALAAGGLTQLRGISVRSCGISVPDKVLTNDDLSATLDTSDAWITERTGIKERRVGGTTSTLAIEAGRQALERAGMSAADIDVLVLATTTPDATVPGTSATVQDALGTSGGAFDLNAACSGFVYALVTAAGLISAGAGPTLVIGSDCLSRITDWDDRSIAVLVGDGAGAVVLEPVDGPGDLLSWNLGADGSLRHLLKCDHGGYMYMDGKEIFRKAVRVMIESAEKALADAGIGADDVDLLVPHQANLRIIQAACQRLGIGEDRTSVVIDRYGNTSSASIPLALDDAVVRGRVKKGDHLLLTGFGGGMTWASAVLRWGG